MRAPACAGAALEAAVTRLEAVAGASHSAHRTAPIGTPSAAQLVQLEELVSRLEARAAAAALLLPSLAAVLGLRLLNAVLVTTQFDPDEWWQAPEVAHRLVFGYGVLTWEWEHQLRGYTHVLPFAAGMQALKALRLDSPSAIAMLPRLMQGGLAAAGDVLLYRLTARYFGCAEAGLYALLASVTSWFVWCYSVRTYSSTAEAPLLLAALCLLPLPGVREPATPPRRRRLRLAGGGALAALALLVRPTAALVLVPVTALWLVLPEHAPPCPPRAAASRTATAPVAERQRASAVAVAAVLLQRASRRACALAPCAVAGAAVTLAGLGVDRLCYGAWVVAWRNFVGFNLLSRGADYYGTHLWWKQGPSVLDCPRLRTALGSA